MKAGTFRGGRAWIWFAAIAATTLVIAACGDDAEEADELGTPSPVAAVSEPTPIPTPAIAATVEPTSTPEPTASAEDEPADTPEPSPPAEPEPTPEPEPEPPEDVDLAPEITALTDWLNGDPVTLADLRGQPVILVFWNSI